MSDKELSPQAVAFGRAVRNRRLQLGRNIKQVARAARISRQTLYRVEGGLGCGFAVGSRLAAALDFNLAQYFAESPCPDPGC